MKKIFLSAVLLLFLSELSLFSQVEIDKPVQLTGSGSDAAVTGIKSAVNSQDATSVESVQSGNFSFAAATGSNNHFSLSISPAIASYQAGMVFHFLSNQTVNGPVTLDVNGLGTVNVHKNFNLPLSGCEIQNGQIVTVIYDGTDFQMTSAAAVGSAPTVSNAGTDQLNIPGSSTSLAGNTPISGNGTWSIVSGVGGNIANPSSPTSTFTGIGGNSYVLEWTISNACGSSSSQVNISFSTYIPGSQNFTSPGGPYSFTVPQGVTSLTLECWGAQGNNSGGNGGYAKGVLSVTPGSQLNVFVGGQNGTNGGGTGGSGANGGGMSDVRQGGVALGDMILVAGGGGGSYPSNGIGGAGGGGDACSNGAGGGRGLAYVYQSPSYSGPGYNGTCNSGGAGGNGYGGFAGGGGGGGLSSGGSGGFGSAGQSGTMGLGGNFGSNGNCTPDGGGGGGGYYGGGGGANGQCQAGGGGGGSSWAAPALTQLSFTGGVQSGDGKVTITW
ncbi:MAG: hypothetical protein IT223_06415 [Crocinitomicaceae bacterium]|nr:hypothetical protein [Crocinitomicaceae bacterium]